MKNHRFALPLAVSALLGLASPAGAHITLESKEVTAGTTVKFVLRVGHGCEGSPTTRIRAQIPEQLGNAKPQPKAGWALEIVPRSEAGPAPVASAHGGAAAPPVGEIVWSGRLEDAYYDEFVFRAAVDKAAAPGIVYLKVVQECEVGIDRWIETPAEGQSSDDLPFPAPAFRIVPPA